MSLPDQVRSFNRFYTREIGLLSEHLPASRFSLAEARVLYELAQPQQKTAADIVRALRMDKAHVSRIVSRFRESGLVKSQSSPNHAKRQMLSLTRKGSAAFSRMNAAAQSQIEKLLLPVSPEDRERLAQGMRTVQSVLQDRDAQPAARLRSLRVGDIGWIAHRQAVLYHREYGWDWTYEGLAARVLGEFPAQFDPSREDAWVAEIGNGIAGSVFLMKSGDPETARLRLLYVEPAARGLGIGGRLVKTCIARAREFRYKKLALWTNDVLTAARRIYEAEGFTLVKQERHRSFGHELVGQTWELSLS